MRCSSVYTGACAVTVLACGFLLLAASSTTAAAQSATLRARAVLIGEGITGTAEFREVAAGVAGATDPRYPVGTIAAEVVLKVKGLKPGAHGVHIHEVGKCEPTFAAAYYNMGRAQYEMHELDGSVRSYQRAVELNPKHFGAWHNLGIVYRDLGQTDKAVEALEKALALNPNLMR